jgi:acetoin utilization deacetylase AcuC-like enzyme
MSEMLMVEQLVGAMNGNGNSAPFILDRHGRRLQGRDDERRTAALREGLTRHEDVRAAPADIPTEHVERVISALHEPSYLEALRQVSWKEPRMMPEWAPPGLPADSPVWAGVFDTAFEGVRTAMTAAEAIVAGERFSYAVCRPPGHHAGPAWLGGYCYLNTAAAAAYTMWESGVKKVAIIDVDFHFPTGTAAIVAPFENITLGSLHASTLAEVPWRHIEPSEGEYFIEFNHQPHPDTYLEALEEVIIEIGEGAEALVLSLGYDMVASDPHGSWDFSQLIFMEIGETLACAGLPVCVVQEGGYSLEALANCSEAFAAGLLMDEEEYE